MQARQRRSYKQALVVHRHKIEMGAAALQRKARACQQRSHQHKHSQARHQARLGRNLCNQRTENKPRGWPPKGQALSVPPLDCAEDNVVSHKRNQAPHRRLGRHSGGELTD